MSLINELVDQYGKLKARNPDKSHDEIDALLKDYISDYVPLPNQRVIERQAEELKRLEALLAERDKTNHEQLKIQEREIQHLRGMMTAKESIRVDKEKQALKEEIVCLERDLDEYRKGYQQDIESKGNMSRKIYRQSMEIERLQNTVASSEVVTNLETENKNLKRESDAFKAQMGAMQVRIRDLEQLRDSLINQRELRGQSYEHTIAGMKGEYTTLQHYQRALIDEVKMLKEKLAEAKFEGVVKKPYQSFIDEIVNLLSQDSLASNTDLGYITNELPRYLAELTQYDKSILGGIIAALETYLKK